MSLKGKSIVFTGKLSKTRDSMQKEAREAGLIVRHSISRSMDLLVCGEHASPTQKEKASTFATEILDEAEYRKRLQGSTASE